MAAEAAEVAELAPVAELDPVAEEATEEEPEQAAALGNCTLTLQRLSAIKASLFNIQDVVSLVGLRIT